MTNNQHIPRSGCTPCVCRDCRDTTMFSDQAAPELCEACAEAGCEPYTPGSADYNALPGHMRECQRDDAYEEV
jgi:ribosomal protein S27E